MKLYIRSTMFIILLVYLQSDFLFAKTKIIVDGKKAKIIPIVIILPIALFGVWRVTHRSGVKRKDIKRSLPGDDLVPNANWIVNRAAVLDAPINEVWPWIQQLGKSRAGWYAPNWMEKVYGHHALRTIDTAYQHVKIGDILDDWGPGYQRVLQINAPNTLVVDEVKKVKSKTSGKDSLINLEFSVVTILEKIDSTHTRIIFRLRTRLSALAYLPARGLGGLFDFGTFEMMTAGLNERLKEHKKVENILKL